MSAEGGTGAASALERAAAERQRILCEAVSRIDERLDAVRDGYVEATDGAGRLDRLADASVDVFDARDGLTWRIGLRHDRTVEAVLGGLTQPLLAIGHRPDFPSQAELAEYHEFLRQGPPAHARGNGRNHGEIGRCLGETHAADDIDEYIV